MKPVRHIIAVLVTLSVFLSSSGLAAQQKHHPDVRIFQSQKAVSEALGKSVAAQIPGYFDFDRFALVFVKQGVALGAKVIISEPLIRIRNTHYLSLVIELELAVDEGHTKMIIWRRSPCDRKQPKGSKETPAECQARIKYGVKESTKHVSLFAILKKNLKKLEVVRENKP